MDTTLSSQLVFQKRVYHSMSCWLHLWFECIRNNVDSAMCVSLCQNWCNHWLWTSNKESSLDSTSARISHLRLTWNVSPLKWHQPLPCDERACANHWRFPKTSVEVLVWPRKLSDTLVRMMLIWHVYLLLDGVFHRCHRGSHGGERPFGCRQNKPTQHSILTASIVWSAWLS